MRLLDDERNLELTRFPSGSREGPHTYRALDNKPPLSRPHSSNFALHMDRIRMGLHFAENSGRIATAMASIILRLEKEETCRRLPRVYEGS